MAGNWYRGGLQRIESQSNAWATDTLYASLAAGSAGGPLPSNNKSWATVGDFTGGGNSLVVGATDVLMPAGRVSFYDNPTDRQRFTWPAGVVNFGTPGAGLAVAGILVHGGLSTDPQSTIWYYQRWLTNTTGGQITWGSPTVTNDAISLHTRTEPSGDSSCNGTVDGLIYDRVNAWNGSGNIQFALVQTGSFNKDWKTVQNALDGGMTFCTGAGFGDAGSPTLTEGERVTSSYDGGTDQWYFGAEVLGQDKIFPGAGLSTGESAIGVLTYVYEPGSASTSDLLGYIQLSAPLSLTTGTDVIFGDFTSLGQFGTLSEVQLIVNNAGD